jgi:hypothetical protein
MGLVISYSELHPQLPSEPPVNRPVACSGRSGEGRPNQHDNQCSENTPDDFEISEIVDVIPRPSDVVHNNVVRHLFEFSERLTISVASVPTRPTSGRKRTIGAWHTRRPAERDQQTGWWGADHAPNLALLRDFPGAGGSWVVAWPGPGDVCAPY